MNKHSNLPAQPPASDVSPWVGVVGTIVLFACVFIARSWPEIGAATGFGEGRGPLSGPNAALLTMALIGLSMAAWSVFVDKVHRRPSTGIDWANPRPFAQIIDISITKIAALWLTWAIIGFLYFLGRWYWDGQYVFAMQVIGTVAVPMFVLAVPYVIWLDRVMVEPKDHAWHFGAMLIGREEWSAHEVKKHWRAWIIKGFFSAFMISILPFGFAHLVEADLGAVVQNPVALGVLLFELLFVIDVQLGTVGYLLTMRPLDAHIRSGNPFLAGWLAALLCYPPLAWGVLGAGDLTGIIQYTVNTADWAYWFEGKETVLWIWAAWLVFLTAIYAWATMAFGIRFSNLTYRGVLTNGPYRFTRHPAYLAKNMFWWCSTMPFLVTSDSLGDAIRNTAFLACVSGIYYWRARTEEAHMLSEDPKYVEYHAWMAEKGLITGPMTRFFKRINPIKQPVASGSQPIGQPAE